ncbi:MAG: hypothetical protein HUU54_03060 [Ignavibacteriaceae bacterium]|nr:hypothetical protein [Ignavibacteriaceae bacterium]
MIKFYKNILIQTARSIFYQFKFLWLFWITNIVFAVVLTLPISTLIGLHLGNSLINHRLAVEFDYQWFLQFRYDHRGAIAAIHPFVFSVAFVYMLIQLFYTGGLLTVILNRSKNHYVDFFYGGVKYFIRFLKVFFVMLLFYIVAFMVDVLTEFGLNLFIDSSYNEFIYASLTTLRYLLFLFLIVLINIMADYSKVIIAVTDRYDALAVIRDAFIFIRKNADKVFIVYLTISSFVAIAAITYNVVDGFLPKRPMLLLIPVFIIQQILIIFRVLIKMFFFTSEVFLYQDLSSDVYEVVPEEISTGVDK